LELAKSERKAICALFVIGCELRLAISNTLLISGS